MMKNLGVFGLVLILIAGSGVALADRNPRGDRHYDRHDRRSHFKQDLRYDRYRGHDHFNHFGRSHKQYRLYYRYPDYRRYYRYRPHYGSRYWRDYYYPSYIGAALIGSAVSLSLQHTHNGVPCYQEHTGYPTHSRGSSDYEVVGCHRIETLPDGTERRIEVPLAECN